VTFDFLTSKYNQFIFVDNCTKAVNLVKFHTRFTKYCVNKLLVYDHARTYARTGLKQSASVATCRRMHIRELGLLQFKTMTIKSWCTVTIKLNNKNQKNENAIVEICAIRYEMYSQNLMVLGWRWTVQIRMTDCAATGTHIMRFSYQSDKDVS